MTGGSDPSDGKPRPAEPAPSVVKSVSADPGPEAAEMKRPGLRGDDVARLPKLPPESLALRARPDRPIRFRRELIIGGTSVLVAAIAGVAWLALGTSADKAGADAAGADERNASRQADVLANAPRSYDDIPRLGPPLPGDLGRPILARQRLDDEAGFSPAQVRVPASDPQEEARLRAEADRLAARQSAVLMPVGAKDRGGAATGASVLQRAPIPGSATPVREQASDVSEHRIQAAASPWIISGGSILSASLITGINSDVPGLVVAQITENAFDSITGKTLLIPQGSRIIGAYETDTSFGQQRAQVVWRRIIWPNGASLRLESLPATDAQGHAGLADRVDAHVGELSKGVLLSTLLGIGSQISLGRDEDELTRALRESLQQNGARAGEQAVGKALDIKPTVKVRPGWPLRIVVHSDLVLEPWRS